MHSRVVSLLKKQEELRTPGKSEARATGVLLLTAAGLVAISLLLPHPRGGDTAALVALAGGMAVAGLLLWFLASRVPLRASQVALALAPVLAALLTYESGIAAGQYGS